jgi:hypothetical protein
MILIISLFRAIQSLGIRYRTRDVKMALADL